MAIRRLTDEEIRSLVGRVVAGELRSLDEALTKAIWGPSPPETWGEWPQEAKDDWSSGLKIYREGEELHQLIRQAPQGGLTVNISWRTILGLAPKPEEWWLLPGVTWLDIGKRIGLAPRRAAYRMTALGWRMKGVGMRVPGRRVVAAPCETCGVAWTPPEIKERQGPCCLGEDPC